MARGREGVRVTEAIAILTILTAFWFTGVLVRRLLDEDDDQ